MQRHPRNFTRNAPHSIALDASSDVSAAAHGASITRPCETVADVDGLSKQRAARGLECWLPPRHRGGPPDPSLSTDRFCSSTLTHRSTRLKFHGG